MKKNYSLIIAIILAVMVLIGAVLFFMQKGNIDFSPKDSNTAAASVAQRICGCTCATTGAGAEPCSMNIPYTGGSCSDSNGQACACGTHSGTLSRCGGPIWINGKSSIGIQA